MNQKEFAQLCLNHKDNLISIIKELKTMSSAEPDDISITFFLVFTCLVAGQREFSIDQLNPAIEYAKKHNYHLSRQVNDLQMLATLYDCRGRYFQKNDMKDEAVNDFAKFHQNCAAIFMLQGKMVECLNEHNNVLKLKPNDTFSLLQRSTITYREYRDEKLHLKKSKRKPIRLSTEKLDAAIDDLSKIITLESQNMSAHLNLATIYRQENKIYLAYKYVNKAIQLYPTQGLSYLERARIYLLDNKSSQFYEDIKKSFELDIRLISKLLCNEISLLIPWFKTNASGSEDIISSLEKLADEKSVKYSKQSNAEAKCQADNDKENNSSVANIRLEKSTVKNNLTLSPKVSEDKPIPAKDGKHNQGLLVNKKNPTNKFKLFKFVPYKQKLQTIDENSVLGLGTTKSVQIHR